MLLLLQGDLRKSKMTALSNERGLLPGRDERGISFEDAGKDEGTHGHAAHVQSHLYSNMHTTSAPCIQ